MKLFAIIIIIFGVLLGLGFFYSSDLPRNQRFKLAMSCVLTAGSVVIIQMMSSLTVKLIAGAIGVVLACYILKTCGYALKNDYKEFKRKYMSPEFDRVDKCYIILLFAKQGRLMIDDDFKRQLQNIIKSSNSDTRKSAKAVAQGLVDSKHINDKDLDDIRNFWIPKMKNYISHHE